MDSKSTEEGKVYYMGKYIITINRQYGSGGRTMGLRLSEELGIPFFDRDLLKIASEVSGINEKLFAKVDEKHRGSIAKLGKLFKNVYEGQVEQPDSKGYTSVDNLYSIQAKAIEMLADGDESCIIMGRCADFILKDRDDVLSLFIHADDQFRLDSIKQKLSMGNDSEILKYMYRTDREKEGYYHYHTGRNWSDAKNYDLCLDSGKLGYDKCIEIIKGYLDVRFR